MKIIAFTSQLLERLKSADISYTQNIWETCWHAKHFWHHP